MDWSISLDWLFIVLMLASSFFFFQILIDYTRKKGSLGPQIDEVAEIQAKHLEEIEKVEHLIEQLKQEIADLDQQAAETKTIQEELEETLRKIDDEEEEA